jgi:hypothetical protein
MNTPDDMTQDEREQHQATVQFAQAALASMQRKQYEINQTRERMEAREKAQAFNAELFDALKGMVDLADGIEDELLDPCDRFRLRHNPTLAAARALIAKTEGE